MSAIWDIDQHHARGRIKPGSVVVDIGACEGEFAIPARGAGAWVLAVEPSLSNCLGLEDAGIETMWGGVGAHDGVCYFHPGAEPTGGWIESDCGDRQMFSLASVVERAGGIVNVLKVDCEGGEYDIFAGADETTLRRIRFMAVELHEWTTGDEPRREGFGHRDGGPAMAAGAFSELTGKISLTHDFAVDGDFLFAELRP